MEKHQIVDKTKTKKTLSSSQVFNNKMNLVTRNVKVQIKTAKGRKLSSSLWIQRHLNDQFCQAAQVEGFISRAAYKLIEIQDKYKIFREGMNVVDLGAAPGSWMQVIWKKIRNKHAKLIGIDLLPIEFKDYITADKLQDNISFIEGSFLDEEVVNQMITILDGNKPDVITSDMAANTTGIKIVEHLSIMNLLEAADRFADEYLKDGGHLVLKIFQGEEQNTFFTALKRKYKKVLFFKPKASRKDSAEVYIVAMGKNPAKPKSEPAVKPAENDNIDA